MISKLAILLALLPVAFSALNAQSVPPNVPLVQPQAAEKLVFTPPSSFKVGLHTDRNEMTEFVPNGQTVDDWTEMLTVQTFRALAVEPAAFLQNLGSKYLTACPGTPKSDIHTGKVNGYVVSMLVLKCPENPATKKPETTVFRVIKGREALYCVQQAWRTSPSPEGIQAVSQSSVCDARDPSHPCPSLDSVASKP